MKRFYSRLAHREEARSRRQIFFYGGLSIIFIICLLVFGIPLLTRLAFVFSPKQFSTTTENNLPLSSPILNPLPQATNSAAISFSGIAVDNTKVEIYLNSTLYTTVPVNNGSFQADNIQLNEGNNTFYSQSINSSGKKSQPSDTLNILLKTIPPSLTVDKPADNSQFSGSNQRNLSISGKTDPDCTITVNDHLAIMGKDGNFSYTFTLNEGDNPLKIIATDQAGNTTEKDLTVSYIPGMN